MVTKTITITEDAYDAIKRMKRGDESFSELFKRMSKAPVKVKDIVGLLKDTGFKERVLEKHKELSEGFARRIADVRTRLKRID